MVSQTTARELERFTVSYPWLSPREVLVPGGDAAALGALQGRSPEGIEFVVVVRRDQRGQPAWALYTQRPEWPSGRGAPALSFDMELAQRYRRVGTNECPWTQPGIPGDSVAGALANCTPPPVLAERLLILEARLSGTLQPESRVLWLNADTWGIAVEHVGARYLVRAHLLTDAEAAVTAAHQLRATPPDPGEDLYERERRVVAACKATPLWTIELVDEARKNTVVFFQHHGNDGDDKVMGRLVLVANTFSAEDNLRVLASKGYYRQPRQRVPADDLDADADGMELVEAPAECDDGAEGLAEDYCDTHRRRPQSAREDAPTLVEKDADVMDTS